MRDVIVELRRDRPDDTHTGCVRTIKVFGERGGVGITRSIGVFADRFTDLSQDTMEALWYVCCLDIAYGAQEPEGVGIYIYEVHITIALCGILRIQIEECVYVFQVHEDATGGVIFDEDWGPAGNTFSLRGEYWDLCAIRIIEKWVLL